MHKADFQEIETTMQKIPTAAARPGMVLAKPVLRDNGMTVLGKDTELTQSVIDRLTNLDIANIVVQGNPMGQDGGQGSSSYQLMLARLDHLFRGYEDDAWMQEVKAFLSGYFHLKANLENHTESGSQGKEQ